jgi:hypothetical protein
MLVYILVILLVVYCIYKERQALGCGGIKAMINSVDCDNQKGKAVNGTAPSHEDTISDSLDKIEYAAKYHDRFVKWRAIYLFAVASSIILWFAANHQFPSEWELVVSIGTLSLSALLFLSFYKFHLEDHISTNIISNIKKLKN